MVSAAVYARISKDDQGDTLGVQRQERLCRQLCAAKGWEVAEVFVDNDITASSGRRRPGYEALLEAIQAGAVEALAIFDFDRLHRRPAELESFFDVTDRHGILLATVGGDVNLENPDDRFKARIMGAVARAETEKMSKRIRAKHAELAEQGRPVGLGASKPFGYQRGGMEIDEGEADLLREAARDVLLGASVTSIARRWNAAGVRTPFPRGAQVGWRAQSVKTLLLSPRPAGLRRHSPKRGPVTEFPAAWPPIFDRATHLRLQLVLAPTTGAPRRRSLLAGLLYCACGQPMTRDSKEGRPTYRCRKAPGVAGCGQGIVAHLVDDAVIRRVVEYLRYGHNALEDLGTDDEEVGRLSNELAEAERLKLRLAEALVVGDFDDAEIAVMRRANKDRIEVIRRRLDQLTRRKAAAKRWDSAEAFQREWLAAEGDIDRRRVALGALVERIEVLPFAGKRRDVGRVKVLMVH